MPGYNPATDADKPITAGVLFTILQQFAEDMISPRSEIVAALGYTPSDAADEGQPDGIATLDSNGKVPASQMPTEGIYTGEEGTTPNANAGIWIVPDEQVEN